MLPQKPPFSISPLLVLLLSLSVMADANALCPNINGLRDEAWIRQGGGNPGFAFPSEIRRVFPGTLDAACDIPRPDGSLPLRPKSFCLPRRPFHPWDKQMQCRRCPPQPINYFKLPLWRKYMQIRKDMVANPDFQRRNPHLFQRSVDESGRSILELKSGFCLTCYALAKKAPPQVLGPNDIDKPSVTITTRVACGKQNAEKSGFDLPDETLLEMFEGQLEAMQDPSDVCTHFPCGSTQAVLSRRDSLNRTIANRDAVVAKVLKTQRKWNEERGKFEEVAVNGHHQDLMEIPFGKAHVLQAEINLNPGLEGYTDAFPDGGYVFWNHSTGAFESYAGCQAMEYGMVAVSPGLVETACWLVPLFEAAEGGPDPGVEAWRRRVRAEEAQLRRKVVQDAQTKERLLRRYCLFRRPRMNRDEKHGAYERGTRTCELLFCAPRRWSQKTHPREFAACRQVMSDAENYRRIVAERRRG